MQPARPMKSRWLIGFMVAIALLAVLSNWPSQQADRGPSAPVGEDVPASRPDGAAPLTPAVSPTRSSLLEGASGPPLGSTTPEQEQGYRIRVVASHLSGPTPPATADLLLWPDSADDRPPHSSIQSVVVGEVVIVPKSNGELIQAVSPGLASPVTQLKTAVDGGITTLELLPVLTSLVELRDIETRKYPEYDRLAAYRHPFEPLPSSIELCPLTPDAGLVVGGPPQEAAAQPKIPNSIPSRFYVLDRTGRGRPIELSYSLELDGYEPLNGTVTAAPLGDPSAYNVLWLTPLSAGPTGSVEIVLLDHRGLYLDDGPVLPTLGTFQLEPLGDEGRLTRRAVLRGGGRTVRYDGIPVGDYQLSLIGTGGLGRFVHEPADGPGITVGHRETTVVRFVMDEIPGIVLEPSTAVPPQSTNRLICHVLEGPIMEGQAMGGFSAFFESAPYVLPAIPAGDYSLSIVTGGRTLAPIQVSIGPGRVHQVTFDG